MTETEEVQTLHGTFVVPKVAEGHTLWNAGPAGVALVHDVRTGRDRHARVPGGTPTSPAACELASSDEVFVGWVERERA